MMTIVNIPAFDIIERGIQRNVKNAVFYGY